MNSHTENNTDNERTDKKRTDKKRWFALYTLALGLAMIVVDGTIVGAALPDIITKLNLTDAQWVNSLYSVVFAALVLSTGRLADRIGRRRMFLVGAAVGATVSGAVLSASLVTTLPDALAKAGLPTQQLQGLIDAVRLSAGSALPGVRHDNPAVADALAEGFALASRNALLAAAAFLFIGLLAALKVRGCEGAKRGAGGRVGARMRSADLGAL